MYPRVYAASTPDKVALVMGSESLTYQQLEDRSNQLAQLWRARGIRPGDQVAIWTQNHVRYYEFYWAAMRSGLYLTGVNRFATAEEAAYLLNDSGAKVLVTSAEMGERTSEILLLIPGCELRLMFDGVVAGYESYEDAVAVQPTEPLDEEPRGEVMLYSSGTTGKPKGIRRALSGLHVAHPDATRTSKLEASLLGMNVDSVYLMPAPLYHAAALMWSVGAQELGGTVVAMERFDAEEMLRLIEKHRVTHVQVVPTMMIRMLKLPQEVRERYDLSSLECFVHSAAPCPPDVKRQMIDWLGLIVQEYYAGTEGSGLTYIAAEDWLAHPGSVGRAMLGVLHVCDEEGRELPPGEVGTVYFEREFTPFSYHNDGEKTRAARHPVHDNWSALGDLGYVDEDGYLYLTDRKAFTIISGGVNIYPAEIESCLVMHPQVSDVVVFGLPDAEMGERVHAVVVSAKSAASGPDLADELLAYARQHLSGYKVPKTLDFRSEIPRMPTGKTQTAKIRAEYVAALAVGSSNA